MLSHISMSSFNLQCEAQGEQVLPGFADRELRSKQLSECLRLFSLDVAELGLDTVLSI